ncbi:MAG: hypothetical protein VXB01_17640 [Opitutae bacterium]
MIEALGQLAVFYLLAGNDDRLQQDVDANSIYFASCDGVRCHRVCKPGDILTLQIRTRNIRHPLALFQGSITVDDEKTAVAEEIKLAFDFERADLPDSVKSSSNGSALEQVSRKNSPSHGGRLGPPKSA